MLFKATTEALYNVNAEFTSSGRASVDKECGSGVRLFFLKNFLSLPMLLVKCYINVCLCIVKYKLSTLLLM